MSLNADLRGMMPGLNYRARAAEMFGGDWSESPSGLYLPPNVATPPKPTCIDLFCGCGGFSLGMQGAGFDVIAGVDWDVHAAMTYLHNLGRRDCAIHVHDDRREDREKALRRARRKGGNFEPGGNETMRDAQTVRHFWLADTRKLTGAEILDALGMQVGDVDCVVGGPPCHGFSKMNSKRTPLDPRNTLVFDFARLVLEIRPRTMCMENVPEMLDMVTAEGVPVVDALCRVLEDGGFGAYDAVRKSLHASAGVGAAMRREPKANGGGNRAARRRAERGERKREREVEALDLFAGAAS